MKLGRIDIARTLLCHGAKLDVGGVVKSHESLDGRFGVLEEAILAGDHSFLSEVYLCLQLKIWSEWKVKASQLSQTLSHLPDFYIEMHWGFGSNNILAPLVKAVAPSDTYRVWKKGTQLRIDCSIKGYSRKLFVERGKVSFFFTGERKCESEDGSTAYYPNELLKFDHDKKKVYGVLRKLQQPTVGELRKICKDLLRGSGGGKRVDASIWNTKNLKWVPDDEGKKQFRTYGDWTTVRYRVLGNASMEIYRKCLVKGKLSDLSEEEYFAKESSIPGNVEDKPKLHKRIEWDINAELWMCNSFPLRCVLSTQGLLIGIMMVLTPYAT